MPLRVLWVCNAHNEPSVHETGYCKDYNIWTKERMKVLLSIMNSDIFSSSTYKNKHTLCDSTASPPYLSYPSCLQKTAAARLPLYPGDNLQLQAPALSKLSLSTHPIPCRSELLNLANISQEAKSTSACSAIYLAAIIERSLCHKGSAIGRMGMTV